MMFCMLSIIIPVAARDKSCTIRLVRLLSGIFIFREIMEKICSNSLNCRSFIRNGATDNAYSDKICLSGASINTLSMKSIVACAFPVSTTR